jgi:hypothetical protein
MKYLTVFLENGFGYLSSECEKKLRKFIENPTPENWDKAYCIIIDKKSFKTLWEAVTEVDETFPRVTNSIDFPPNKKWKKIPTKETLKKVFEKIINKKCPFN